MLLQILIFIMTYILIYIPTSNPNKILFAQRHRVDNSYDLNQDAAHLILRAKGFKTDLNNSCLINSTHVPIFAALFDHWRNTNDTVIGPFCPIPLTNQLSSYLNHYVNQTNRSAIPKIIVPSFAHNIKENRAASVFTTSSTVTKFTTEILKMFTNLVTEKEPKANITAQLITFTEAPNILLCSSLFNEVIEQGQKLKNHTTSFNAVIIPANYNSIDLIKLYVNARMQARIFFLCGTPENIKQFLTAAARSERIEIAKNAFFIIEMGSKLAQSPMRNELIGLIKSYPVYNQHLFAKKLKLVAIGSHDFNGKESVGTNQKETYETAMNIELTEALERIAGTSRISPLKINIVVIGFQIKDNKEKSVEFLIDCDHEGTNDCDRDKTTWGLGFPCPSSINCGAILANPVFWIVPVIMIGAAALALALVVFFANKKLRCWGNPSNAQWKTLMLEPTDFKFDIYRNPRSSAASPVQSLQTMYSTSNEPNKSKDNKSLSPIGKLLKTPEKDSDRPTMLEKQLWPARRTTLPAINLVTIASLKGKPVILKPLTLSVFNQKTPPQEIVDTLTEIKKLSNINLVPMLGIAQCQSSTSVVFSYISEGNLKHLLSITTLEPSLRLSVIQDICNGLSYFQESIINIHGELSTRKFVFTSHFCIKLLMPSFNRMQLFKPVHDPAVSDPRSLVSKEYEILWMAPERLREPNMAPTSAMDIYSFAIIIHQVLFQYQVFYRSDYPEELLEGVKKQSGLIKLANFVSAKVIEGIKPKPFRPHLTHDQVNDKSRNIIIMIMEACWNEQPGLRPVTFKIIQKKLRYLSFQKKTENETSDFAHRVHMFTGDLQKAVNDKHNEMKLQKDHIESLCKELYPAQIARKLINNEPIESKIHESVTIYCNDIVGFTTICSQTDNVQAIASMLNHLFHEFERIITLYFIHQVMRIGDAIVLISGAPDQQPQHASEICMAAIQIKDLVASGLIKSPNDVPIRIRSGIATGSCATGVIGIRRLPQYVVFGEALTLAEKMESHGEAMKIQITKNTRNMLSDSEFFIEQRNDQNKLDIETFWLVGHKNRLNVPAGNERIRLDGKVTAKPTFNQGLTSTIDVTRGKGRKKDRKAPTPSPNVPEKLTVPVKDIPTKNRAIPGFTTDQLLTRKLIVKKEVSNKVSETPETKKKAESVTVTKPSAQSSSAKAKEPISKTPAKVIEQDCKTMNTISSDNSQ